MKQENSNRKKTRTLFDTENSAVWQQKQQQQQQRESLSAEVKRMIELYGSSDKFLETFKPELQLLAARCLRRAYLGTAPTLATVASGYGWPVAEVWLCLQLEDINSFVGVKEKLSIVRQKELARLCMSEYGHLRITELMLCFHRLKCGRYGRFYGSVDSLFISSALLQFMQERKHDLARIREEEQSRTPQQRTSPTAITYSEYLALKEKKKEENEKREGRNE